MSSARPSWAAARSSHPGPPGRRPQILLSLGLALLALVIAASPVNAAASVAYNGSRLAPRIALTFDDGFYPSSVLSILATLRREGIRATFFPTSDAVKASPDVWRRVAAAGMPIGNHTINHPNLTGLSWSSKVYQITASRTVIERVTGYRQVPYLRPPYGAWNASVVSAASSAGYRRVVLWDVDSRDWQRPSRSALIYNATRGRNGSIVLLHTLPGTADALTSIIRSYKSRGYRFVTVPQMFQA
jgi:peptidoglycan/xylan/chitin deacetylase (PgdA/CDA1 family)